MALRPDLIEDICALAVRQAQELYPNLQLMFIPHENGQFGEIIESREHDVTYHPAGDVATSILEKNSNRDLSSFLGMAIHTETKWMGLVTVESMLGLFNLNMAEFSSKQDAQRSIYHLIWHAFDLYEVRQKPEYISKYRSGPMIPKRSPMNLARLNLQADIFAASMAGFMGEKNAMNDMAMQRAQDSVAPVYSRRAEDYPYVIALETAQYAFDQIRQRDAIPKQKYMYYARQIAVEVSQTYDEQNIRNWWGFSEPSQDMAWRGLSSDIILGCAIYTSEDPFVRATAHVVSDITEVTPLKGEDISRHYNSFANQQQNQMLHRELMEKTFQDAIALGIKSESGRPLLVAANEQNEGLLEGRIIGWCAGALQAAARAFENAISSGVPPLQAAKIEFESTKNETEWDHLKKISEDVIEQKRNGFAVTLNNLADLCAGQPHLATITNSLQATVGDPAYQPSIKVANDFTPRVAPAPAAPAPKGPAVAAPSMPSVAPAGPSLGGMSNARARQHMLAEQRKPPQDQDTTSTDEKQ